MDDEAPEKARALELMQKMHRRGPIFAECLGGPRDGQFLLVQADTQVEPSGTYMLMWDRDELRPLWRWLPVESS
jgi:hypothetical protein